MTTTRAVPAPTTLVVGLGAADRGDDAVGGHVARAVAALADPRLVVTEHADPTDLIEVWGGYDAVVVVDATCSGATAGAVHVLVTGASSGLGLQWAGWRTRCRWGWVENGAGRSRAWLARQLCQ